ncbi:MAG: RecX family transcriptional regulator [Acholeplasmataceae bacterium]|nr:RecX family transcriptional regulator [Acholeplasmataceae bacterium]
MPIVKSIQKNKKTQTVHFDEQTVVLDSALVLKYHLSPGIEISKQHMREMIAENEWLVYDKLAIERLKKIQTVFELETFLKEKGAPTHVIDALMKRYHARKYIDDDIYVKTYIQLKKNKEGPLLMLEKLKQKGVDQAIIDQHLSKHDETSILKNLVMNKIKASRNKTKKELIQQLKVYLLNKGFTMENTETNIKKGLIYFQTDESALLEKTYAKLLKTYERKLEGYALKKAITQKLLQKGYLYEDIKKLLP